MKKWFLLPLVAISLNAADLPDPILLHEVIFRQPMQFAHHELPAIAHPLLDVLAARQFERGENHSPNG